MVRDIVPPINLSNVQWFLDYILRFKILQEVKFMQQVEVKIVNPLLLELFELPAYATDGAAGLDLRACISESMVIKPGETKLIGSGIAIGIHNPNLAAVLVPRSGLGAKHGIVLGNLVGLIDSDYQGEVRIAVWNRSDKPFTIQAGERICQMIFVPIIKPELVIVEEFTQDSKRGDGGFGHTGRD